MAIFWQLLTVSLIIVKMRADRLVALLLLLQRKGTVTARQAAEELEVSVRTARRDFEALSASGVPVYAQPGRGGGWRLLGGGSTDLSGLTSNEARALFVAAGRSLEAHPHLRAALRKLAAALPEPFQDEAESASASIRFDDADWSDPAEPEAPPLLETVTDAVIAGRRLDLDYWSPRTGSSSREVSPLGLVAKRGIWYLMALTDDGKRTFRVDRIRAARPTDGPVERPPSFELDAAWEEVVADVQALRLKTVATARVQPDAVRPLKWYFGTGMQILDRADDGCLTVRLAAHADVAMAAQIAGFGERVRLVDAPDGVVEHLRRIGRELSDLYPPG